MNVYWMWDRLVSDDEKSNSPQVFLKYGAFLAYLQSKILVYNTCVLE